MLRRTSFSERSRKSEWSKVKEQDKMRRQYVQQKGYHNLEKWECKCWSLYKVDAHVNNHLREKFPLQRPLNEERLLQEIFGGKLFSYLKFDIEVLEYLKSYFLSVLGIFKITVVSRTEIGYLMRE